MTVTVPVPPPPDSGLRRLLHPIRSGDPRIGALIAVGLLALTVVGLALTLLVTANRLTNITATNARSNVCTQLLVAILASDEAPPTLVAPAGCSAVQLEQVRQAALARSARRDYLLTRVDQLAGELSRHGIPVPVAPRASPRVSPHR